MVRGGLLEILSAALSPSIPSSHYPSPFAYAVPLYRFILYFSPCFVLLWLIFRSFDSDRPPHVAGALSLARYEYVTAFNPRCFSHSFTNRLEYGRFYLMGNPRCEASPTEPCSSLFVGLTQNIWVKFVICFLRHLELHVSELHAQWALQDYQFITVIGISAYISWIFW